MTTPSIALSDVGWRRRARALIAYLEAPRTRTDVVAWAEARGMSRSRLDAQLAWLRADARGGTFVPAPAAAEATWRPYERAEPT